MPHQFNGQRSNEEVLLLTRQHPSVLVKPLLQAVFILLIPAVLYLLVATGLVLSLVIVLSLLCGVLRMGIAWYLWQNSLLLLTDQRVILLDQRGLLHREFAECGLESIQQVSHQVKGLVHTLFSFGDISIITGGAHAPFVLPNVPHPYEIQSEIQRAVAGEVLPSSE